MSHQPSKTMEPPEPPVWYNQNEAAAWLAGWSDCAGLTEPPAEGEVAELALKELEQTVVLLMPVTGHKKIKRFDTIRAALKRLQELENKADLNPAPAPAWEVAYAADVRRMCDIILGNTFGNEELDSLALLVGHYPDVLNASPAPAEGEVAELVTWLRNMAEAGLGGLDELNASRAADLLEQRHPAPVPMSERLPGPEDCDAGRCYWGRQDSGRQQWNWTFSTIPMGDTHWLPAFVQSLPTIVLPLPQGEVK